MTSVTAEVPIEDPHFYMGNPWPTFARMRAEEPFYYYEPLDCFVLTRVADIRAALSSPSLVSSRGIFLNDWKYAAQAGDSTVTDSFFPKGGEQVGTTDPPRQTELRRVIAPAFSPRAMMKMTDALAADIESLLDEITPGQSVDWIHYASLVPIKAATKLIGLPDTDADRVQFWSDELEKLGGDITFEELEAAAHEFQSLQAYIIENLEIRKQNQQPEDEDLLTVLLNAELDGKGVSEANVVMFAMTAMAAGSDTTRASWPGWSTTWHNTPSSGSCCATTGHWSRWPSRRHCATSLRPVPSAGPRPRTSRSTASRSAPGSGSTACTWRPTATRTSSPTPTGTTSPARKAPST